MSLQTSSRFWKPSAITSLTFAFVIPTGTNRTDGTSIVPLFTEPVAVVASSPRSNAIASAAAPSASALMALYTVFDISPVRTARNPSTVASCPDTQTLPFSLFFLRTAIAASPRPSLAETTASSFPPAFDSCCSKITPPFALSQSGTAWSSTSVYAFESTNGRELNRIQP